MKRISQLPSLNTPPCTHIIARSNAFYPICLSLTVYLASGKWTWRIMIQGRSIFLINFLFGKDEQAHTLSLTLLTMFLWGAAVFGNRLGGVPSAITRDLILYPHHLSLAINSGPVLNFLRP